MHVDTAHTNEMVAKNKRVAKMIDDSLGQMADQNFESQIEFRVARTRDELKAAYRLVYQEYLRLNYIKAAPAKMRISLFNALPETTTFISQSGNKIIATATIIPDSELGLPMDEIYHEHLAPFRKQKRRVGESTMLANDTSLFPKGTSLLSNAKKMFLTSHLFKLLLDYSKYILRLDHLCVTTNPKHSPLFNSLLFHDLGELKAYEYANGAPAIGKIADINTIEDEFIQHGRTGMRKFFFQKRTETSQLENKIVLSPDDLRYFFCEKTDLLQKANDQEIAFIKKSYPDYDFSSILQ